MSLNKQLMVKLDYYSYARLIDEILSICKIKKIKSEIIGYELFEKTGIKYPIYRFVVNPKASKKICLVAGIHGYEIAGPLCFLELLKESDKYLSKKVNYWIYPVINPVGFDLRTRYDDDKCELNTINKKVLANKKFHEVKCFYQSIKKTKFEAFISLHEDVDESRFYEYIFEKRPLKIYRQIISEVSKSHKILRAKNIYGDASNQHGLIINCHDQSFEDYMYQNKQAYISFCTETPGKLALNTRIRINLENIKMVSDYIL